MDTYLIDYQVIDRGIIVFLFPGDPKYSQTGDGIKIMKAN